MRAQIPVGYTAPSERKGDEAWAARYIASAACSSLSCASSSSSSAVCIGSAQKGWDQIGTREEMWTPRTGCDLAGWMVYWDVVCARKPRIELLLLQVREFLLQHLLVTG